MNKWTVLGLVFFLLGFGVLVYNFNESNLAKKRSEDVMDLLDQQIQEEKTQSQEDNFQNQKMQTINIDGYEYIGKIILDDLGINLPVISEWENQALTTAPCRLLGSPLDGDMVIVGHNYRSHFGPLLRVKRGEDLVFEDVEGKVYSYEVENTETLKGDEYDRLVRGEGWDLSLVTCTLSRDRFVIRCKLKE